MTLPRRGFLDDEELGKKYDDRDHPRPRRSSQFGPPSSSSSSWKFPRRRRLLLSIISIWILYLFFKNMPTDLSPATERFNPLNLRPSSSSSESRSSSSSPGPPAGPPPNSSGKRIDSSHYYGGSIKFYSLARSLYSAQGLRGYRQHNKIVLFAAADLKSLADLLPLACQMASKRLNRVHFAVMGRSEVSVEGIQMVNGVDAEQCPLFWHDARPDYGPWSTDDRMASSVKAGLSHINNILRPKVIITHDERRDESFLWKTVKAKASRIGVPHIGLPARAANFMWMSRLDSSSLEAWNKVDVEILVQAPPASSGSLSRLLSSLQKADYFGDAPGLTIELPPNVDAPLMRRLESFKWPPNSQHSHFKLRRRIQPQSITPEEATLRAVDAFYPHNPSHSHVLVISPQTDIAPSYYHYLKYAILKYKYSLHTKVSLHRLLGISLELPSIAPTDGEPFTPPTPSDPTSAIQEHEKDIPVFLWQAPNSNAALYFGDKWVEFHSFLSNRLAASRQKPDGKKQHPSLLSRKFPSWMEYMLELIRARGYYLVYPSFPATTPTVLATAHNELYQQPEEYEHHSSKLDRETSRSESGHDVIDNPEMALTDAPEKSHDVKLNSNEKNIAESSTISNLLNMFPGGLPDLSSLDVLPYSRNDEGGASSELVARTEAYLKVFRREIGGCDEGGEHPTIEAMKADDLFCLKGEGAEVQ
ncbi:hypothetical protein AJ79_03228 [Helicocarpus griseus UAMH5409]|uniref:Glycosyltransferase 2 n=1 Tax=Helicocarpus griseus UAMH5409 TaxID=1447875 RepID=A0A2B7XZA7_9EURO|nr:hypothetical protein AJ79_03228 [Helicocarpus griseus UAMH5409]